MKKSLSLALFLLLSLFSRWVLADEPTWYTGTEQNPIVTIDFFLSSTCPHCHKADEFLKKLEAQHAGFQVNRYLINEDKAALELFNHYLQAEHSMNFAVPSLFFCKTRWVGFVDAQLTGKLILKGLNFCRQQIIKEGELSEATVQVLREWSLASQITMNNALIKSPTQFLITTAFTDAFSPCALFVFFTFFAFLWIAPNILYLEVLLGVIGIITIAIINYISQAHTVLFIQLLNAARFPALFIGLGVVLFGFFTVKTHHLLYRKMYIFPLLTIVTLPLVMLYQQTCGFNMGLLFQQWIMTKKYLPSQSASYYLLYQCIYIIPLILFFLLHLYLTYRRPGSGYNRLQGNTAAIFLVIVGLILMLWPKLLNNFFYSLLAFAIAIGTGWIVNEFQRRRETS